ncbi:hypothetical protein [Streptomyces lasalocidi]|uniref:hypothetical protein n=1 Tax=Streptomyces lasalocidi TaxID=324833 RepID=UPI0015841611|nr:hypothetical protein [Streptomyces lasalocidi]
MRTAHPAGPGAVAHPRVRMIRAVTVSLLARDVELTDPAARRIVFHDDLDHVHVTAPAAFAGPRLARAVLGLAAADADAGEMLAERTAQWKKIATVDGWLHRRLLAAHLTARTPDPQAGAQEADQWQAHAYALVPRLLAGHPDPKAARLVEMVWRAYPPEAGPGLEAAARAALGMPPSPRDVDEVLPGKAQSADGRLKPLASWLRVWDWSPVLLARLLAGYEPLLTALRRLAPDGPADPRTAVPLQPVKTPTDVGGEGLVELAAAQGPLAAARALPAAEDAGADIHAGLLNRLVATAPAAWTTDVPAVLQALDLPALRAFFLTAAQAAAHLPGESLGQAIAGALRLHRPGAQPPIPGTPAADRADVVRRFADEGCSGCLPKPGAGLPARPDSARTCCVTSWPICTPWPALSPAPRPPQPWPSTAPRPVRGTTRRRPASRAPSWQCARWSACWTTPQARPAPTARCPPTSWTSSPRSSPPVRPGRPWPPPSAAVCRPCTTTPPASPPTTAPRSPPWTAAPHRPLPGCTPGPPTSRCWLRWTAGPCSRRPSMEPAARSSTLPTPSPPTRTPAAIQPTS